MCSVVVRTHRQTDKYRCARGRKNTMCSVFRAVNDTQYWSCIYKSIYVLYLFIDFIIILCMHAVSCLSFILKHLCLCLNMAWAVSFSPVAEQSGRLFVYTVYIKSEWNTFITFKEKITKELEMALIELWRVCRRLTRQLWLET